MKANHLAAVTLAVLTALASCVPKPAPPPVPQTRPLPRPVPVRPQPSSVDWRDMPQTPGGWRWDNAGGRSTARFGSGSSQTLAAISCTPARDAVEITVAGAGDSAAPIIVTTTSLRRTLTGDPARSAAGQLTAALSPRDTLLDAMAFSRGRFAIEIPGTSGLYLPSWPEISRVIEDCR